VFKTNRLSEKVDSEKDKLKVRASQSVDPTSKTKFECKSIESTAEKGSKNSGLKQKDDNDSISIDFHMEESLKKRKQKRQNEFNNVNNINNKNNINDFKKLNSSVLVKDKDMFRYKSSDSKNVNNGVPVNSNLEKMSLK